MANTSASGGFLAPSSALPPEDNAFDAVLQALIVGVTALPGNLVRPRWQPVPSAQPDPTVNWCAVGVVEEFPASGKGMITHDGSDQGGLGSDTLQVNDEVEVMASFYGPNARQFANLFRDGVMIPQNREMLEFPPPGTNVQELYRLVGIPRPARFVPEIINEVTYRRVDVSFRISRANVTVWPVENLLEVQGTLFAKSSVGVISDPFTQGSTAPAA
jgi:hypothetical protein